MLIFSEKCVIKNMYNAIYSSFYPKHNNFTSSSPCSVKFNQNIPQNVNTQYLPMYERSFGIHEVKLMIQTSPCLSNCSCIAQHTTGTRYLCKITSRYHSWWLVIDSHFETSWTPINKLKYENIFFKTDIIIQLLICVTRKKKVYKIDKILQ